MQVDSGVNPEGDDGWNWPPLVIKHKQFTTVEGKETYIFHEAVQCWIAIQSPENDTSCRELHCTTHHSDYCVSVERTIVLGGFTSHSLTSSGAAFESFCMKTWIKVQ